MYVTGHIFSFIKSRSLTIWSHVRSAVGPGKDSLTSLKGLNSQTTWPLLVAVLSAVLLQIKLLVFDTPPPPPRHLNCRISLGGCSRGISREAISSYKLFCFHSVSASIVEKDESLDFLAGIFLKSPSTMLSSKDMVIYGWSGTETLVCFNHGG